MESQPLFGGINQEPIRRRKTKIVALVIGVTLVLGVAMAIALPLSLNRGQTDNDSQDQLNGLLQSYDVEELLTNIESVPTGNRVWYFDPEKRAGWLLKQVPLIDGHNDLAVQIRTRLHNQFKDLHLEQNLTDEWRGSRTDIPRLRAGQLGGQFWSCYVPCSSQYTDAVRLSLDQCDVIRRFITKYPDTFRYADSATDILRAFYTGHVASLIGLEGGHSIDSSLGTLRQFYDIGVRYMTLTHTCNTPWADSSPVDIQNSTVEKHGGLTAWGERVVMEMNRLGMLVDLSHVAKATMEDALRVSRAPVMFSHSSAWALCHHHRNVRDSVLKQLKINNGIIMVTFVKEFTSCYPSNHTGPTTEKDVADHIEYIHKLIGPDHIGIGSDFDGVDTVIDGLEDTSKFHAIFVELIKRGWTNRDLAKLAGLNLYRVFRDVEKVRDSLGMTEPLDDVIDQEDLPVESKSCRTDF